MTLASIGDPKFISIRSFRKSGVAVDTPVWAAADNGRFYVTTPPDSGKGKRIRNNPQIEIAVCDMRGKLKGEFVPAEAHFTDDPAAYATAMRLLAKKYGLQFKIAMWRNRNPEHIVLEIRERAAVAAA